MDLKIEQWNKNINKTNLTELSKQIYKLLTGIYGVSPWTAPFIKENLQAESSRYFLARADEKLVGFLSLTVMFEEIEVTNLAVSKEFQHQKIASRLLTKLSNEQKLIFLEVRESNLIAQGLYEKFGFKAYHLRKNYYNRPVENAILMRRSF